MNPPDPAPLDPHEALRDLRARAERRQLVSQSLAPDTPDDVRRLVQELQVHQIELEMQYEQLLVTQAEADASRAQYTDLYEFAPVGYCTVGPDGTVHQLNLRAAQLLGTVRQRVLGRRLAVFVAPAAREAFATFVQTVLASQVRHTTTLEMRRDDGSTLHVRLEALATDEAAGLPRCRLALLDVSEQHLATQALELSERRFRTLFEQSSDAMLLMRDNRFVDCNAAALHMLGFSDKAQVLGRHAADFSPERQPNGRRSVAWAEELWAEALRRGHCRFEWCRLRAAGGEFWEDVVLTTIPDEPGRPLVCAAWRDITTEKTAVRQLRESEERLQAALQASALGVIDWNLTTDQLFWDARAQAIFGHPFSRQPVSSEAALACVHPDDQPRLLALVSGLPSGSTTLETEYRVVDPADGTVRHVTMLGRVLTDAQRQGGRLLGLVRDISARREAEAELSYKNRLLEHILAHLPVLLGRLTPDGAYVELVGQGLRRMGLRDNELVGHRVFDAFPSLAEPLRRLLAGEQVNFVAPAEHAGQRAYYQNFSFFDAERQQAVLFAVDVTESEQMKLDLQTEQEFTKSLLDSSVDCIIACDADLRVTAWNRRATELLGTAEAAALGRPLPELLPRLAANSEFIGLLQSALQGQAIRRLNWPGRHPTSEFDLNVVPLPQGARHGVLIMARDVTERNVLLAETTRLKLRQQQEVLKAILHTQEEERRRIAEGLHNGVGQLLYATKLNLEQLPPSEPVRASLRLLDESIRATRTISFELTPGILEDFGLPMALRELVLRIPKHSLSVELDLKGLDEPLPRPLQTAVYRIVQELLNNVMKHAQAQSVFVYVHQAEGQVHIGVEDDGVGFDADAQALPKGMGLASIRNRVELLGGTLQVRSRAGHGTSIALALPLPDEVVK